MWLALAPPPGWIVGEEPPHRLARPPGAVSARLEWSPLALLPTQERHWFAQVLCGDVPDGARLAERARTVATTVAGWQVLLVEAAVEVDGEPREERRAGRCPRTERSRASTLARASAASIRLA